MLPTQGKSYLALRGGSDPHFKVVSQPEMMGARCSLWSVRVEADPRGGYMCRRTGEVNNPDLWEGCVSQSAVSQGISTLKISSSPEGIETRCSVSMTILEVPLISQVHRDRGGIGINSQDTAMRGSMVC